METTNLYKKIKTIIICFAALGFILSLAISCKKTTAKPTPETGTIHYTSTQNIFGVGTAITPFLPMLTGDKPAGFSIIPALPTGLILNTNTGAISGLPTVTTGATVYTVTANYLGGTTTNTTINITVVPVVTTFAGNGQIGHADGMSTAASFNNPAGVALDAAGNVYVADINNYLIRKITPSGLVSTFAGNGQHGYANGMGTTASFGRPSGIAVDATGNVYVADFDNSVIRKITPAGMVTTFAGNGQSGHADGMSTAASFNGPLTVAVDATGNVYVADFGNFLIRKITPTGLVSTLAGSGRSGLIDGMGTAASFRNADGIAVDAAGNVYVVEGGDNKIRKITPAGMVTTFAGNGQANVTDGTGLAASFWSPRGIAVDAKNDIYITEVDGNVIRKITPAGLVSTFAGRGQQGSTNGVSTDASFNEPAGVAVDATGNFYVADWGNNLIRKIIL